MSTVYILRERIQTLNQSSSPFWDSDQHSKMNPKRFFVFTLKCDIPHLQRRYTTDCRVSAALAFCFQLIKCEMGLILGFSSSQVTFHLRKKGYSGVV